TFGRLAPQTSAFVRHGEAESLGILGTVAPLLQVLLAKRLLARVRDCLRRPPKLRAGRLVLAGWGEVLARPLMNRSAATVDAGILPVVLTATARLRCGNLNIFSFAEVLDGRANMAVYGVGRRCALDRRGILLNVSG